MAPTKKTNAGPARTRKPMNKRWTQSKKKTPSAAGTSATPAKKSPPKKALKAPPPQVALMHASPGGPNHVNVTNPTVPLYPLVTGIPEGAELTEIIACWKGVFICNWADGLPTTLVDRRIIKMEYPQQVIHFYEKQIRSYERNLNAHVSSDSDGD